MQTIVRNVELQANEQLEGSFSVSNLQSWQDVLGDTRSYSVPVTILDPEGQVIESYTQTTGNSFDYTAFYSGVYTMQFTCGSEYLAPSGIPNPEVTLNYNVVSANQQTQTDQPNLSTANNAVNPRTLGVIIIAAFVLMGIVVIAVLTKKGILRSGTKNN
jgi:hypothetical protein